LVLLHRCRVVRGAAHRRMHTQTHAHAQTPKHARKHAPWTRQPLCRTFRTACVAYSYAAFAGLAARTDAAQGINRQRRLKEEKRLTLPNACGKKDNTEASSGSGWMYKRCTLRAGSKLHPLMPENGEASVLPAGGAYLA